MNDAPSCRAKFQIESVVSTKYDDTVTFSPSRGTPEDNTFAQATPAAELKMTISTPNLRGKFRPGQEFYCDLTPVPDPTPTA